MTGALGRWLAFATVAAIAGWLHQAHLVTLVAWAPRPFADDAVPLVLAVVVAGHGLVMLAPPTRRVAALAVASLAAWLVVSPAFVGFGLAWVLGYRRLLWSSAPRWASLAFPIVTLVALLAGTDAAHFPSLVARNPWAWVVAYAYAVGWFLRALVVWHEARTGAPRPTPIAMVAYFFFAPFALVPPYMLALPRLGLVVDGVRAQDPAVVRSGLAWIGYGLAVQLVLIVAARAGVDPQPALVAALRARAWAQAVPLMIVVYPGRAVFEACGAGALVLGLVRSFGVPMAPAFDRPLLARGVADWWRRYNTHFRQLLIDLFWMPVALRLRRRPIAAAYLGCAAVFLLGSVPLHWPKQAALHGSPWSFPWSTAAESVVMTVLVGTALALAERRRRRRQADVAGGWVRAWSQRAGTWAAVCAAILVVGYQIDYRVRHQPWETLAVASRRVGSAQEAAALVPALVRVVDERPFASDRRLALAVMLAAAGEPARAAHQLGLVAAFATEPALADARLVRGPGTSPATERTRP